MISPSLPIRFFLNPRAVRSRTYGTDRGRILNQEAHEAAYREISSWDGYGTTPLLNLKGMARSLGIETLWYKDEGIRFGLGSFKALGGIYGVFRVVQSFLEQETGISGLSLSDLNESRYSKLLSGLTVTCASAGNHGRAIARGAEMCGCRSVVFLPTHTSAHRVAAIRALGSRTVSVEGSFDDAVALAAREAQEKNWSVVADTAYPGYKDVPRHIMQGYTVMAREILEQLPGGVLPTHVFLQAGVGGMAAAVTGHFWGELELKRPRVVVVEPAEADCLMESALMATPSLSTGSLRSSMECLACRRVSDLAWEILVEGTDAFMTIPDFAAEGTVDTLREGLNGDPPVLTQPSGAAGMAGLISASFEPGLAGPLGLGKSSRVLIIGSEGPAFTKEQP